MSEPIYLKDGSHKLPPEHSNIKLTLPDGKEVIYNFSKTVQTNPSNINHEAIHLPATRHFTGHLLARAEKDVEETKILLKRYIATKRSEIRNKHPKLTDKDKDDLINQDETVFKLQTKLSELQFKVNQLWSVISGLNFKKDLLQTVSSNLRVLHQQNLSDAGLNALEARSVGGTEAALESADQTLNQHFNQ